MQVSLSMNIIVYLETYTYERGHLLFGILLSLKPPCLLSIILWRLQVCLVSASLISIRTFAHSHSIEDSSLLAHHGEYVDFVA